MVQADRLTRISARCQWPSVPDAVAAAAAAAGRARAGQIAFSVLTFFESMKAVRALVLNHA